MSDVIVPERLDGRSYPMPQNGWTCFHCGETFTTWGSAEDHFGETQCSTPACQIKLGDERGLVMELRKFEKQANEQLERALDAERDLEAAQCRISSLSDAMHGYKPFRTCNSINEVFFLYDSMEGRALAAEERLGAAEAEGKRIRAELHPLMVSGNHLASAMISIGWTPDSFITYQGALACAGQPYADMWMAWKEIMNIRAALATSGKEVRNG